MTDRVRLGTMLIADGTPLPASFVIRTEQYSAGWSTIDTLTPAQFGRQIEAFGWTFFYMAGDVCAHGFGTNNQSRTKRALAHLFKTIQLQHCNSMQITQVTQRSFCGVPYISIVAHARHIQQSEFFHTQFTHAPSTHARSTAPLPAFGTTRDTRSNTLFPGAAVHAWENEGGSRN